MSLDLLFLGTGTSTGIPMIGCHCAVCSSADPRDRRTRTSALLSYDSINVLIDATPELRVQCLANRIDRVDAIVLTHAHADHIMGLDDVRRFNTIRGGPMDVFADGPTFDVVGRCFGYAFKAPNPLEGVFRPHLHHHLISGPFTIGGRQWHPIPLMHGQASILGFRVGNLAYCTDVSSVPEPSLELLNGLDVLVLDGLQFKAHPTHFSIDQAVELSRQLSPRRTYLTHIAHQVSHLHTSRKLPPSVELAYDGLRLSLV